MVEALREYIFMHIPKTGGTSIRTAVVEALEPKGYQAVYDYQGYSRDTEWLPKIARDQDLAMIVRKHFAARTKLIVSGHFHAARYLGAFHPQSFFCFIRDPFDLVFSSYNHQRKNFGYNESFEHFILLPLFQDRQSKLMSGLQLNDLGFFGLLVNVDDEIAELSRFLGAKLVVGRKNRGKYDTNRLEFKKKWYDRVIELNRNDCTLYENAVKLKEQQRQQENQTVETAHGRGRCRLMGRNRIHGWATIGNGRKLATVKLVNASNHVIAETRADLYRMDLQRPGGVRHGVAGFEFIVSGGVIQSDVRVIIKETGQVLIPARHKDTRE